MKIKRYLATDMRNALRAIREEQGSDAVILSSRATSQGVEVCAAVDLELAAGQGTMAETAELKQLESAVMQDLEREEAQGLMNVAATGSSAASLDSRPLQQDDLLADLFAAAEPSGPNRSVG